MDSDDDNYINDGSSPLCKYGTSLTPYEASKS